ncbi:hypothetical protein [Streptomyces sp. NPDC058145]|uniref:hypothetical protein n=1 Tax=Streptomyces sp. NPDC058145 TaxID=3346356 RepID=UPI0036F1797B
MNDPFDLTTAALVTADGSGLIKCWSPRAEKLLGHASADMAEQPVSAVLQGPDGTDGVEGRTAPVEGRLVADSWEDPVSVRHQDGHRVGLGLRVRAVPVPGAMAAAGWPRCAGPRTGSGGKLGPALRGLLTSRRSRSPCSTPGCATNASSCAARL